MHGEIPRGNVEGTSVGTHDEITEGSYGKITGGVHRCILSEASVQNSEWIVREISEAFLGKCSETITIGTSQDVHGKKPWYKTRVLSNFQPFQSF